MSEKFRKRIYNILNPEGNLDPVSKCTNIFIVVLIMLNVVAAVLDTMKSLSLTYSAYFEGFEIFSVIIFSLEYLLRIWSCTINPSYAHPVWGRIRFAISPCSIVDLVAIIPFYLPMLISGDFLYVRALRLMRLFRVFKMRRYSNSLKVLTDVVRNKKEELIVTIFTLAVILVVASGLMFHFENDVQPEAFSNIPDAMWCGLVTLTQSGLSDIHPISAGGKAIGVLISLVGIGLFALPSGIIASGLVERIQKNREPEKTCPHCGKQIGL